MTAFDESQCGTLPDSSATAAREVLVRQRTKPSSKDDLLEGYRSALRQEVREQELAALVAEIARLREDALDHRMRRSEEHAELVAELKRLQTPPPASEASLTALATRGIGAVGDNQRDADIPEGFELVSNAFLDVEEIANMLSSSIVKRKPLQCRVRVAYNDKAQRELYYMQPGVYGLNPNMRSACLTQILDDPDLGPYIKGTYIEYGQTVDMSPEQIERVAEDTLHAIRKLWLAAKDET
jgi:hypothetical protein